MKNENLLDQFFLINEKIDEKMVEAGEVLENDNVIEIGAGRGFVTKHLAKKAKKVSAVEIDPLFEKDLKKIGDNVEVIIGEGLEYLDEKTTFSKIFSSLPSSIVEPIFPLLCKKRFNLGVFLIPLKYWEKLSSDFQLNIYLKPEFIEEVEKENFNPQPKTNWALIKILKKPDPLKENDKTGFLMKYICEHPTAKLKNSLMEALITYTKSQGKALTKNQAREILKKNNLHNGEGLSVLNKEISDFCKNLQV